MATLAAQSLLLHLLGPDADGSFSTTSKWCVLISRLKRSSSLAACCRRAMRSSCAVCAHVSASRAPPIPVVLVVLLAVEGGAWFLVIPIFGGHQVGLLGFSALAITKLH